MITYSNRPRLGSVRARIVGAATLVAVLGSAVAAPAAEDESSPDEPDAPVAAEPDAPVAVPPDAAEAVEPDAPVAVAPNAPGTAAAPRPPETSSGVDVSGGAPDPLAEHPVTSIGALSVGHPHAGYLFNAVQLPKDPRWVRTVPEQAWATEETVRDLTRCIARVHEQFPGSPPVMIGAISARHGGHLPPHKSHRTGRDADVYLFRTGGKWFRAATAEDLDRPRTWALLRAFATEADVDMILLDRRLQVLLEDYARSIGEDPEWLEDLFRGRGRYPNPLVKHVPGHVAHMHVRFASPIARERGRLAYDQLVELGHIEPPGREVLHEVGAGDTLSGIARRHNTTVDSIVQKNALMTTKIRVGQKLLIQERQDVRDARAAVVVPPRRLPAHPPRAARDAAAQRGVEPMPGSRPPGPRHAGARAAVPGGSS
jgi:murein endopeptidase